MDAFFAIARRSRGVPIIAIVSDAVVLNRAAEALDPVDRAAVVRAGAGVDPSQDGGLLEVPVANGSTTAAFRIHTRTDGVSFPGVILEAVLPRLRRLDRPARASLPGLVGASPAWTGLCRDVDRAVAADLPILVVGAEGTGKTAVATGIHALSRRVRLRTVAPASDVGTLTALRACITDTSATTILRHLDRCDADTARVVSAELGQAAPCGRLIGTARSAADVHPDLQRRFPLLVEVPDLSERRDDIPDLAAELVQRFRVDPSSRLQPAAVAALRAAEYRDNVRGLEHAVRRALTNRRSGTITAADLPDLDDATARRLTALQRSEREAIRAALTQAAGNKAMAAKALGIARGTLYKRIAEYQIET
jgi:transcriptional regulator of acetoin/glycerol metabolism